ncbi:MAG: hypothetical protein ABI416_20515 [Ginsengibacter sp.]
MKTGKRVFPLLTFILLSTSCQKNISDQHAQGETKLVASKTYLKTGEAVSLSVVQSSSQGVLSLASRWTVAPGEGVHMDSVYSFSQNTITFSQPGVYTVNADLRKVECSPEAAAHPGLDTCFNSGTDFTSISNTITVTGL